MGRTLQAMAIKAVTLDLDDTLWDITPVIEQADERVHAWLRAHHPRMADRYPVDMMRELRQQIADLHPHMSHDLSFLRRETFRVAAAESGDDARAADEAFEIYMDARHDVVLYDDVRPALETLGRYYRIGAVSNGNADLDRVGLGDLFDCAVGAASVGAAKPAPAVFEAACAALRAQPQEIVHVGDHHEHDVRGAAAAGMRAVWINRGGLPWPGGAPPDGSISSLAELEALIANW
jgi:2-haloalkanoic acid dehalogenase type II